VAVASFLPFDQLAGTGPPHHRRLIAYAQIGALGEICQAWHQGVVSLGRDELVDELVSLFGRIAGGDHGG
jgi:hypothetical protein